MNIAHILQQQSQQQGDSIAIIDGPLGQEHKLSFEQLDEQSARFAALLRSHGLKPGDTVLIFQPISSELYIILMAIFRLGLVAMFVDPSSGIDHLNRCCQRVMPDAFIGNNKAQWLRLFAWTLQRIPLKFTTGSWFFRTKRYRALHKHEPLAEIASVDNDTPALITFTSGSTGLPKAAVRTHGFLLAQHKVLADNIDLKAGEVDVSTLPIFVLANLASGLTSLLCDVDLRFVGKVDAQVVLKQMQTFAASRCAASPAFFHQLVKYCQHNKIDALDFKRIDTGGAPVFPGLLTQLHALAKTAEVVAVYGSTEAEPIAHVHYQDISPDDLNAMRSGRGLLAGKPVSQIDVKVLRDQSGQPIVPLTEQSLAMYELNANQIGEIVVAGEHVLPGYLDGVGNEETKFSVDGRPWHRTGDAGYFDEQGRLWLMGRCSAKISDRHGTLYPFAVETVLMCDPTIARCALVARNDQRLVVVQAQEGHALDAEKIKHDLQWASIDRVLLMNRIPVDKRHNAKIDYPALNKQLKTLLG